MNRAENMNTPFNTQLLERFFKKECTPEEAQVILAWLQDSQNEKVVKELMHEKWLELNSEEWSEDVQHSSQWKKYIQKQKRANDFIRIKSRTNGSISIYYRIAAVLAIVLGVSLILYKQQKGISFLTETALTDESGTLENYTKKGDRQTVILPDGTKVYLNSDTRISYPKVFTRDRRIVYLEGEAYFEVAHDPKWPFDVLAGPVLTTALGTTFNVHYNKKKSDVTISLTSGKVEVALQNTGQLKAKEVLNPGEEAVFHQEEQVLSKNQFEASKTLAWKNGILMIDNADVFELKDKLEKWYDTEIIFLNLPEEEWRFSGSFRNESLKNVLNGLSYSKDITYSIEGKIVKLKFKNDMKKKDT